MVWLASVDLRKYLALDHPLLLILQTPVPFLPLQIWIEGKATPVNVGACWSCNSVHDASFDDPPPDSLNEILAVRERREIAVRCLV